MNIAEFKERLTVLLNQEYAEKGSDTPDVILAEYLLDCLESFNKATLKCDKWWDFTPHLRENDSGKIEIDK